MSGSEEERRPRPIGVADESEEGDSDVERNDAAPAPAPQAEMTTPEETAAKKPSRKLPAFSENDLAKEKGLWRIYKEFPQKCRYKGKGREAEFLRGLMVAYKEWGYQLYPGIAFEDLAGRTEKLGGRARTRELMRELRDAERDRVVEAKYGREAVDNVRAQEAAKLEAKGAKTAATREGKAEEREDEELAGSRYMEVDQDEGGGPPPEGAGGGEGGKKYAGEGEGQTAAGVMSEQVRQRMEVNRRLALERLRLKKEEAAAAAAVASGNEDEADGAGAAAMPVDENDDTLKDPMDVDGGGEEGGGGRGGGGGGGGGGGADDDFEDDAAALAEMEAYQVAASTAKPPQASAETPKARAAAVPASAASAAAAARSADTAQEADPVGTMTSAEPTTRGGDDAVNDDDADGHAPAPTSVAPRETAGEQTNDATPKPAGATPDPDKPAPSSSGGGREGCADGEGDSSRSVPGPFPTVGMAAEGSATVDDRAVGGAAGGAAEPAAARGDAGQSFSSPTKCKAGAGLPLSPLGNMFASTDVPAEGGSIAVRAPLGGLFSDENV